MPTNRRRRLQGRREPLSEALKYHLLRGEYPERGQFPTWADVWFLRDERQHEMWLDHRDELLTEWTTEHPGSRPWAWWRWDAPESRRCVRGAELLLPTPAPGDWEWCWRWNFGIPGFVQCRPAGFDGDPEVESEAAYLDRHRLLGRAERARLADDAFEPEEVHAFTTDEGELDELIARGDARRVAERLATPAPTNGNRHSPDAPRGETER